MSDARAGRRLAAWSLLVGALIALAYYGRFTEGKPEKNVVYTYDFAVGSATIYALLVGVLLSIAIGLPKREAFALRRPASWGRAIGLAITVLIGVYVLSAIVAQFADPGGEQGLTPTGWDGDRAGAFVASFVVIAVLVPVVEELTFRGLGYSLLERFGARAAIIVTGVAFGLAHGLIEALPLLAAFGIGLAILRSRTGSVIPGIVLHGTFNAIALIVSVAA